MSFRFACFCIFCFLWMDKYYNVVLSCNCCCSKKKKRLQLWFTWTAYKNWMVLFFFHLKLPSNNTARSFLFVGGQCLYLKLVSYPGIRIGSSPVLRFFFSIDIVLRLKSKKKMPKRKKNCNKKYKIIIFKLIFVV